MLGYKFPWCNESSYEITRHVNLSNDQLTSIAAADYFNACTVPLLLFCAMTNKCTIISQIITLQKFSTLLCHSQGACNQRLVKLHNKFTIISQIITLLHVSTLLCYPQGTCNQYLAKLHKYLKCSVGNTVYNYDVSHCITKSCIWNLV